MNSRSKIFSILAFFIISINYGQTITMKWPTDKSKKVFDTITSEFFLDGHRVLYERILYEEEHQPDTKFIVDYYSWNKIADKYLKPQQKKNHNVKKSPLLRNLILKNYSPQNTSNDDFFLIWNLAILSIEANKSELASSFLTKALISLDSGKIKIKNTIKADFYNDLAKYSDTWNDRSKFYLKAIENAPNRGYYYINNSIALIHLKKIDEAEKNIEKAKVIYPNDNLFVLERIAEVAYWKRDYEKALKFSKIVLDNYKKDNFFFKDYVNRPGGFNFKIILAICLMKKGDLFEAEEILTHLDEFYKKDVSAIQKFRGELYIKAGFKEIGCEIIQKAYKSGYQKKYFYENDFLQLLSGICQGDDNKIVSNSAIGTKHFKALDFWNQFDDKVYYKNKNLHFERINNKGSTIIKTYYKNGNLKNEFIYDTLTKNHIGENKEFFNSGKTKTKWTYNDQGLHRLDFDEVEKDFFEVKPLLTDIDRYNEKIEENPSYKVERAYLRYLLGNYYLALEDLHSISEKNKLFSTNYVRPANLFRNEIQINFLIAKIYLDLGFFEKSIHYISKALYLDKNNYLLIGVLAEALFNLNDLELSKYYVTRGLKINSIDYKLNKILAKTLYREKDLVVSSEYSEKAKNELNSLINNYEKFYGKFNEIQQLSISSEGTTTISWKSQPKKYIEQSLFDEKKLIIESKEELLKSKTELDDLLKYNEELKKSSESLKVDDTISFQLSSKIIETTFSINSESNFRYQLLNYKQDIIYQGVYRVGKKINVAELEAGLYFLKIYDKDKKEYTRRFVKE